MQPHTSPRARSPCPHLYARVEAGGRARCLDCGKGFRDLEALTRDRKETER